jgi:plastocyanin
MNAATCRVVLLTASLAAAQALAADVHIKVLDADGQPLNDAVAFLDSPAAKSQARPLTEIDIIQRDKRFTPAVTVVTVGTPVSFPNQDTVRHHVYSFSPTKVFDIKLYVGRPAKPVVFDKPGIAVLGCNIHDTMVGWTVVLETPWFAKAQAGQALIKQVPAGTYTLRVWHPAMVAGQPAHEQPLTLAEPGPFKATVKLGVKGGA